ncbi:PspC domain-containing protein [Mucilaginibacter sp. RS28]|uniref:PspC domain-containing protein n=1 Tax=Mucilaginibacter straminoryzae TaxID=2932774 RepID=A0A9X1X8Q9_9SPHI|nr:PspC domain-containing protein [Mucilaginibacter straminoryzae]MCJ8211798.1 PspC domain-containing protein [Mucilaginibacter straminoryzae]
MNKTIIININGTVFHIEETAYEILKAYMTAVKKHFFNSEDSLEITTDIENRIAELFTEILLREGRQVVIEQDVNMVVQQMGSVEDFDLSAGETSETTAYPPFTERATKRRLFRDPDDHLISGVCAGIGNYFDIKAVWIRLAFAFSLLFFGTGLFLYIILWLVIPKATTRADRMAMKGEKLNIEGFKRNFEAELTNVRGKLGDMELEARPFIYRFRDFIQEFFGFAGNSIKTLATLILKLIGIAFMVCFFGLAIALIVLLVSAIGFKNDLHMTFPFSIIGYQYAGWIYFSVFLIGIIPLIAMIVILSRAIFNTPALTRSMSSGLLITWICALSICVYLATKITANFRQSASFDQTINIKPTTANTYYLKLNNTKFLTKEDSARLDIRSRFDGLVVTNEDDEDELNNGPRNVWINIERSDVAQPVLVERYHAKGKTYEEALMNARNTQYNFTQKDTVLNFDYRLHQLKKNTWHNEEINLTLKLPLNSKIIIERALRNYTNADFYACASDNKLSSPDKLTFMMTENGIRCKVDTLKIDTAVIKPNAKKL